MSTVVSNSSSPITIGRGDSGIRYKIGTTWTDCVMPLTIVNTDTSSRLLVLFEEGLEFQSYDDYLICASNNIQFGSTSSLTTITIKNVTNYQGLIENGNYNTYILNISVLCDGSTLLEERGWIGQRDFSQNNTSYIVNCHSNGPIPTGCGGIVGEAAGISGDLNIIGCSSSGIIGQFAGGIVAKYANNVKCYRCWSTGAISADGGGIFGEYAGQGDGSVSIADSCYSNGIMHHTGGGIFGHGAGNWFIGNGRVEAIRCYSIGATSIGDSRSGGIMAGFIKRAIMSNCYCIGTIDSYISSAGDTTIGSSSNIYATFTWNTTNARSQLLRSGWIDPGNNSPYILSHMGYSPYVREIITINDGVPSLVTAYNSLLAIGGSTIADFNPAGTYSIINSGPYITISNTGQITVNPGATIGKKDLYIVKTLPDGSYSSAFSEINVIGTMESSTSIRLRYLDVPEYSTNNGLTWNAFTWPIGVRNTGNGTLSVLFDTDFTLGGSGDYFVVLSDNIQFGSTSLKSDGSLPVITISNVTDYPGLISNGTIDQTGYDFINVFNLQITVDNSTLATYGGWFGQRYSSCTSYHNYFINCHTDGDISTYGGGILGANAGSSGLITISGCSSAGQIGQYGGGIVGSHSTNVYCNKCWSTGAIGDSAGGIVGSDAARYNSGDDSTFFNIYKIYLCYSTGSIGVAASGIIGPNNVNGVGVGSCYSRGTGAQGVGIGSDLTVQNCYCINGQSGTNNLVPTTSVYAAGGNWNDSNARSSLTGAPTNGSLVGNTWISPGTNQPYELRLMGYSPYTLQNISFGMQSEVNLPSLVTDVTLTAYLGGPSSAGTGTGRSYQLLQLTPSSNTITFNQSTGSFSIKRETVHGNYSALVRSTGSYHITTATLTVTTDPTVPCLLYGTKVLTPDGYRRVEDLVHGDLVSTGGRTIPIVGVYNTRVKGTKDTCPALIARGSISRGGGSGGSGKAGKERNVYPPEDLRISQSHLIKYGEGDGEGEVWVNPGYHPIDTSYMGQDIVYYHIRLPDYVNDHLTIDGGVVVESLGSSEQDFIEYERRIHMSIKYQETLRRGNKYMN